MFKVCIVEDEIVVREGIKNIIPWETEGFEIVGDEGDGELAYAMILKERPDIIITDIKMPFLDGLELSKLVKKALPQVKIIIISGYSDFSYAQQAIDIGVAEYILKPVTASKIMAAVKHAAASIEKERQEQQIFEHYQTIVSQQQIDKRKVFFQALVTGQLTLSQIVEQASDLGMTMVAGAMCVVLFQYIAKAEIFAYSGEMVACEHRMQEILEGYTFIESFDRGIDGFAYIIFGEASKQVEQRVQDLCDALLGTISDTIHCFGGIGRVVNRSTDIQRSFMDANKAFSLRHFEKMNQFISYRDLDSVKQQLESPVQVSQLNLERLDRTLLTGFLGRGTLNEVEAFVNRYFEGLDSDAMNSVLFRQYIMMDGYSAIMKFLKELNCPTDAINDSLEKMKETCEKLNDIEDCKSFYKSALEEALHLRNQRSQKSYAVIIERAKSYIKSEYANSDLTLDKVASKVNISPNYFSTLFNQETGKNFIEFLTEIRMDKAKTYLRSSNKKITEIGSLVGYLDSHYFSYIFRKTQDCTPSEYRLQGKGRA